MQHHPFRGRVPAVELRVGLPQPAKDMNAQPVQRRPEHSRELTVRYTFEENGAEHDQRRRAAPIHARRRTRGRRASTRTISSSATSRLGHCGSESLSSAAYSLNSAAARSSECHESQDQLTDLRWAATAERECSPPPPPRSSPTRTHVGPNDDTDLFFDLDES